MRSILLAFILAAGLALNISATTFADQSPDPGDKIVSIAEMKTLSIETTDLFSEAKPAFIRAFIQNANHAKDKKQKPCLSCHSIAVDRQVNFRLTPISLQRKPSSTRYRAPKNISATRARSLGNILIAFHHNHYYYGGATPKKG